MFSSYRYLFGVGFWLVSDFILAVVCLHGVGFLCALVSDLGLRCRFDVASVIHDRDVSVDDIECSFGSHLVLTPREQAGVVIGSLAVSNSFIGFTYSLVAKVLVYHRVNSDGFIKTFLNLWNETKELHGVPSFYMMIVVAQAIGAMLEDVIQVDNCDGSDCEGRFIRNRVRFDVTLPLIRQAPVTFPEAGEKMVEFMYEYLPNYCFACGRLGHSTQVCLKKYESINGPLTPSLCDQLYSAFANLEGDHDSPDDRSLAFSLP
ncbi:hypothetical protein ACE6H2_010890 [Prunus campanulata]